MHKVLCVLGTLLEKNGCIIGSICLLFRDIVELFSTVAEPFYISDILTSVLPPHYESNITLKI